MSSIVNNQLVKTYVFILVGVHADKSMSVNGHPFIDGRFEISCTGEQAGYLTNAFSFYGALPEDDAALVNALAPDPVKADKVGSPDRVVVQPPGDAKPTLAEAIALLDPENDAHWTSNHLPATDDLSALTGEKVTRADVEAIAEGFTRAKARALRAG